MKRLLLIMATITLVGCTRPGDHPINQNCLWLEQDTHSLDLTNLSDRRHLRFDAVTAEDVAIRWADAHFSHLPEYGLKRDECMQTLFEGIATQHGVDIASVREYSRDRDPVADAAVIFSFGVLYLWVAYIIAGRIRRRFTGDDRGFWIMTLTMAVGVSLIAVMVGGLASIVIETVRLNSGHLSYRMNRIPFRQYWTIVFVCCFVIFGLASLMRSRVKLRIDG